VPTRQSGGRNERRVFVLLGTVVEIEASAGVLDAFSMTLADVAVRSDAANDDLWRITQVGGRLDTFHGDALLGEFDDEATAVIALAGDIELHAASTTADFVAIHAGAVAFDGQALLLPGRSLAGKSTLARALLEAGADYLSDEYALLDADGNVHAYPRPLRLRRPGRASEVVPASEIGSGAPPEGPLPVGLVAQLRHDAVGWQTESLSRAQTTLALIDNAVPAQSRPGDTLTACSAAARQAVGVAGTRGEAAETAALLIELLRS
jgi:hypothetical protein